MPAHKFHDGYLHFVTATVVDWIDVFTRPAYAHTLIDSLSFCQQEKGLEIYAYVIMPSHIHMIIGASPGHKLSDIMRDFKQFTSRKIIRQIHEIPESRRTWLLDHFEDAAAQNPKVRHFQLWQPGNHPIFCESRSFTLQKLNYIHMNPVKAQIVKQPEHYVFSSAADYAGQRGLLKIKLIDFAGRD